MRRPLHQTVLIYAAVLGLALITLAPIVWLFIMSIANPTDLVTVPLKWIPSQPDFSRYGHLLGLDGALSENLFLNALKNSLIAAGGATLVAVAAAVLAAYGFARRRAPLPLLFTMLGTYMMPPITYVLPLYALFSALHVLNSPFMLVLVYCSMLIPFACWLLKSTIDALPTEIEQAAMIEGAGTLRILWQVILPMIRPALVAAAMLSFLIAWDEFFYALLFTSDLRGKTLPVAIADFAAGRVTDYGVIAAIGILATLPPTAIALAFQQHLISGLSAGGVKG